MNARSFSVTLFFLLCVTCLQRCASKETVTLAGADDHYISIDHGNEHILLNSPVEAYYATSDDAQIDDVLRITRQSTDGIRSVSLVLSGANLRSRQLPKSFGISSGPDAPTGEKADIYYTSLLLGDDPVCPHLVGEPTLLRGTIFIESWRADGLMTGSFFTDPNQAFQFTGDFQVLVP